MAVRASRRPGDRRSRKGATWHPDRLDTANDVAKSSDLCVAARAICGDTDDMLRRSGRQSLVKARDEAGTERGTVGKAGGEQRGCINPDDEANARFRLPRLRYDERKDRRRIEL